MATAMNPRVAQTWARRSAVFGLTLFLCLSIAELVLRWQAPLRVAGIQSAYQYDPDLGLRLRPGTQAWESSDYLKEVWVNSLGTVNFQESFDSYSVRVFTLGDSYTQGTGSSVDASYPFQLDLALNQDESGQYLPNYAVVNLGLAAFGGEQSLLALRRYADALGQPRACLYLGSENDCSDDLLFLAGYRHQQIVEGSPSWGWLVEPALWATRFELFKRLKIAVSQLRRKPILSGVSTAPASSDLPSASTAEHSWDAIARIRDTCRAYGAPIIVSWAAPGRSYTWLQTRAAQEDIQFADWWPSVQSVLAAVPDAPLSNPHSGGHWRPWINRSIAQAFEREVRALQLLPEDAASSRTHLKR